MKLFWLLGEYVDDVEAIFMQVLYLLGNVLCFVLMAVVG